MAWPAAQVAEEIRRSVPNATVTVVHKLLYLAQGVHLAHVHRPPFGDRIAAWDLGPVVPSLWAAEKHRPPQPRANRAVPLDEAALNSIAYVVSCYGRLPARDLVALTHAQAPWVEADRTRLAGTSATIPVDSIEAFFAAPDARASAHEAAPDSEAVRAFLADARARVGDRARPDDRDRLLALATGE